MNDSDITDAASGIELPILQLAVDSGFATTEFYQWARRQAGRVLVDQR
jgi:phage terminase large subunit GpA-like protein